MHTQYAHTACRSKTSHQSRNIIHTWYTTGAYLVRTQSVQEQNQSRACYLTNAPGINNNPGTRVVRTKYAHTVCRNENRNVRGKPQIHSLRTTVLVPNWCVLGTHKQHAGVRLLT
jgi:hypothetical protein